MGAVMRISYSKPVRKRRGGGVAVILLLPPSCSSIHHPTFKRCALGREGDLVSHGFNPGALPSPGVGEGTPLSASGTPSSITKDKNGDVGGE
ncbi:hypothetical protein CDAR_12851 [Caerostris darwini]|uniref:Uncharacterized protein n=1 Tax=Caerostris darwini TaxID=1538125 RepID=A0AAV4TLL7_9ARAC|nr:hypothetical protein CDAR_12851 [Caerostris darwini]